MLRSQWVMGREAAQRFGVLASLLLPLKLKNANEKGSAASAYSPWLPLAGEVSGTRLHEMSVSQRGPGIRPVLDMEYLTLLSAKLREGTDRPLGRITHVDISSDILLDSTLYPSIAELVPPSAELLLEVMPWLSGLSEQLGFEVFPISHYRDGKPWKRGFSHVDHLGAIFLSFQYRFEGSSTAHARAELAVDLAHEIGHQVMMIYQHSDSIIEGDPDSLVYSSVRQTLRPAIMAMHAAMAMAYMMEACAGILKSAQTSSAEKLYAAESLSRFSEHQPMGLRSLRQCARFTKVGEAILSEFEAHANDIFERGDYGATSVGESVGYA
ncbi:MAG: hypothetical protein H6617_06270 [Bdellovibrionaceae bacterium]|nr:hypothetical protein [Pseudobdellovibrionaceae bacterium]